MRLSKDGVDSYGQSFVPSRVLSVSQRLIEDLRSSHYGRSYPQYREDSRRARRQTKWHRWHYTSDKTLPMRPQSLYGRAASLAIPPRPEARRINRSSTDRYPSLLVSWRAVSKCTYDASVGPRRRPECPVIFCDGW